MEDLGHSPQGNLSSGRGLVWGSRSKQSEESVSMVWLLNVRYQNPTSKESVHIWLVIQPRKSESESSEDTIHTFSDPEQCVIAR